MKKNETGYSFVFTPTEKIIQVAICRGKSERESLTAQGFKRLDVPPIFRLNAQIYYFDGTAKPPATEQNKPLDEHYTIVELKELWKLNKRMALREQATIFSDLTGCAKKDCEELIRIFREGI